MSKELLFEEKKQAAIDYIRAEVGRVHHEKWKPNVTRSTNNNTISYEINCLAHYAYTGYVDPGANDYPNWIYFEIMKALLETFYHEDDQFDLNWLKKAASNYMLLDGPLEVSIRYGSGATTRCSVSYRDATKYVDAQLWRATISSVLHPPEKNEF
jgi:hypothetical protein